MSIKTVVGAVLLLFLPQISQAQAVAQAATASAAATPAARCRDGTVSTSASRRDACSGHGGVAEWNIPADATARCHDGTYSTSTSVLEMCANHGGVAERYSADQGPASDEQAAIDAMKSDLRKLVAAQAAFFEDSGKFTARIGKGGLTYAVAAGNFIPRIALTQDGWVASISSKNTRSRCMVFIGSNKNPPAIQEGVPACVAF